MNAPQGASPLKGAFFGLLFAAFSTAAMGYAFSVQWSDFADGLSRTSTARPVAPKKSPPIDLVESAVLAPIDAPRVEGRLDDERALLDAARSALTQMALGHATAKLREHKQRFPEGELVEEREALNVWRVAQEGDVERTHAAADSFLERFAAPSRSREQVKAWRATP